MKDREPKLEVAARQTNDNTETPSDILEHVSVLYKYNVHNEYVVRRWEGTKHMLLILLAHTNLNAIIMADVQIVNYIC
jgi:hypothetical protein